jgi:hypothetical protein
MVRELNININILRIADVDTGSVVAVGNNYFCDWRTYAKSNSGFGRLNGDRAAIDDLVNMVEDPDLFDMVVSEPPELKPPEGEGNCLEGDCEEN